jgi:hypothetical protein
MEMLNRQGKRAIRNGDTAGGLNTQSFGLALGSWDR